MEKQALLFKNLREFFEESIKEPKILKEISDNEKLHDVSENIKLLLQLD